ncbi:MAG: hypothetical protein NTX49_01090 [Chlamydiae bacterium]|nr:hypothetical protein [Chlamydiota bacterium]
MKRLLLCGIASLAFSLHADQTQDHPTTDKVSRVYVGGYGGYGSIDGMVKKDGQYAQFRLALGVDAYTYKTLTVGLEGAVQSGKTMRVNMSATQQALTGDLPPQAILSPFIDLLAVARWNFVSKWHLLVKGGIAYRELQFTDRTSSHDSLRRINGELQAGIGYQLTKHARLVGLYQGIYSESSLGITLSANDDVLMHHIPMQQAGLLGVEFSF